MTLLGAAMFITFLVIFTRMIGERIKELRKKHELSQAQFAAKVNVSQPMIMYWENGTKPVSAAGVAKICKEFKIESSYFYAPTPMGDKEIETIFKEFQSLSRTDQDIISHIIKKFFLLNRIGQK
jgi:transcriptional regulator with XRE-family HTH domain